MVRSSFAGGARLAGRKAYVRLGNLGRILAEMVRRRALMPRDALDRMVELLLGLLYARMDTGDDGEMVVIAVTDTGMCAVRGDVFSIRVASQPLTTRRFGGTGLGLAISRRLARMIGGRHPRRRGR